MGYTEDREQMLAELQTELVKATTEKANSAAKSVAANNTLAIKTKAYSQNQSDAITANANLDLATKSSGSIDSALKIIEPTILQARDIMNRVYILIDDAYNQAELTAVAAGQAQDLAEDINEATLTNKLISDLLTADAKTVTADATKAVTDSINALKALLAVAEGAVHSFNAMDEVKEQVDDLIVLMGNTNGIIERLTEINDAAQTKVTKSLTEMNDAATEAKQADGELLIYSASFNTITNAIEAANKAVGIS